MHSLKRGEEILDGKFYEFITTYINLGLKILIKYI